MKSCSTYLTGLLLFVSVAAGAQRNGHYRDYRDHRNYRDGYRPYSARQGRVVYRAYPAPVVIHRPVVPYRYYPRPVYPRIGASISIITPSIGVHISTLPFGYRPIWIGPSQFFYYGGTYYRRAERDYEVVHAPIGAEVPDLPERARVVVIDNNKYYELDGTYYRETIRPNGEIWYTVTGKGGNEVVDLPRREEPVVGAVVPELPQGCKVIVLNNQKYYVAPDGTYFQELIENNQILYKVAGLPAAE